MPADKNLSFIGSKRNVLCNGGFMDGLCAVNAELRKKRKKEAIGFEKDLKAAQRGHNRIRFFDADNKTVWLPDEMYKKVNLSFIRMGAINVGRQEYPKLLASGNCKSLKTWLQKKKQQFQTACSHFMRALKGR